MNPETPTTDPTGSPPPDDATVEIPAQEPAAPLAFSASREASAPTFSIPAPPLDPFPSPDPAAGAVADAPPTTLLPSSATPPAEPSPTRGADGPPRGRRSGPSGWPRFVAYLAAVVVAVVAAFGVGRLTAPETEPEIVQVPVAAEPAPSSATTEAPAAPAPAPDPAPASPATPEAPPVEESPPVIINSADVVAEIAAAVGPAVVQLDTSSGVGSGVIYSTDGYILTAAHVVDGSSSVTVRLADGASVDGTVLGTHGPTDVAVVKIDGSDDLPTAALAVGDEVKVGQLAVALGSPFGLDQTVTSGIVSSVDRVIDRVSMVQTDAAINPGNSGGPLVDVNGRVIGINDQIFTQSGGNQGVGFAISIDLAAIVADQIVAGEEVQLAFLGVSTDPASNLPGALVVEVVDYTAAEAAGIEVGDRIVTLDGRPITEAGDLRARIINTQPGTEVTIELLRDGESVTLVATLGGGG